MARCTIVVAIGSGLSFSSRRFFSSLLARARAAWLCLRLFLGSRRCFSFDSGHYRLFGNGWLFGFGAQRGFDLRDNANIRLVLLSKIDNRFGKVMVGMVTLFFRFRLEKRLTIGEGDLIVIRVDFRKGQKAVAIATIIHEGGLKRRFDSRYLGQVNIAANLFLVLRFKIEFFNPVARTTTTRVSSL